YGRRCDFARSRLPSRHPPSCSKVPLLRKLLRCCVATVPRKRCQHTRPFRMSLLPKAVPTFGGHGHFLTHVLVPKAVPTFGGHGHFLTHVLVPKAVPTFGGHALVCRRESQHGRERTAFMS